MDDGDQVEGQHDVGVGGLLDPCGGLLGVAHHLAPGKADLAGVAAFEFGQARLDLANLLLQIGVGARPAGSTAEVQLADQGGAVPRTCGGFESRGEPGEQGAGRALEEATAIE